MKIILVLLSIFLSIETMAAHEKNAHVEGIVQNIKENTITLWVQGNLVTVKKSQIPSCYLVSVGRKVAANIPLPENFGKSDK